MRVSTPTQERRRPAGSQILVIMVMLILSLFLISEGLLEYVTRPDTAVIPDSVAVYLTIGALFLAVSVYWLFVTRQRMVKYLAAETQPLSTTLMCQKCGLKNLRDFQRGDYVFKQTDESCPKDNEKMTITAIYREIKDKSKEAA